MGKKGFFLFGILAFSMISQNTYANWYGLSSNQSTEPTIEVLSADSEKTIIQVDVNGFEYQAVQVNGQSMTQVQIPGASLHLKKGLPELPQISRNILIPWGSQAKLAVLDIQTAKMNLGPIAPSKGSLTRNINPEMVPFSFAALYQSSQKFPEQVIQLNSSFIMRDTQGVGFTLNPVRYDFGTQQIEVIKSIRFEIRHKAAMQVRFFNAPQKIDEGFQSLYETHFLNYKKLKTFGLREVQHPMIDTGKILIISHKNFLEGMKPFVKWKLERGFEVKMVSLDEVGIGWSALKGYIQKEYDVNKMSYVILVGDAEFVPFHPGRSGNASGNEADPLYTLVAGNDNYPDIFISRISVKNETDLANVVGRSINYEKNPELADWYSKGTGIASDEGSWSGLKDWQRADLLREMMLKWHYMAVDQHYDPKLSKSKLIQDLNDGRGYVNYIGHGSQTSWGSSGFSNYDIDRLTNGQKMPFIVSVACVNGDFNYSGGDSFAERWLKAGTPEQPKGAVAIFASSTNQAWVEPTIGQKTITELLTQDKMYTIGSLFFHGSVSVLESNMGEAAQTFETWHIFGDASLQVRSMKPTEISVKFNREDNPEGSDEIVMQVDDDRISGAVFMGEQQIGRGYVECCGELKIKLNQKIASGSELRVVLTGFNKIPTEKVINKP
jgi:hypothetical protein